jgi:O-antigen/teichoic acid export membrane protein
MIGNRRIVLNAGSSIVQLGVAIVTLFVLYRFLLDTVGAEGLGIWSLVLAASSMVQLANFGFSGSVVKQVADYDAKGDRNSMVSAIETAVISIAIAALIFTVAMFPIADYYIQFAFGDESTAKAMEILPLALAAFWTSMVTGMYQGALYGRHLIVQRNAILITESVTHLALCMALAPKYGLPGLAYARLGQNILTLLLSVVLLKRHLPDLPWLPIKWSKRSFREMIGYAATFQVISLLVMICDPLTKGLIGRFGSVAMVAYYEMANRVVQQLRGVIVSANQVLVPTFANLNLRDPGQVSRLFASTYEIVYYLAVPGFSLLAISAPLISIVWIGRFEPVFILTTVVLSAGWLLNTLAVPSYFVGLGTGKMRANLTAHVVMTLLNVTLGVLFGLLWGGYGVVFAWTVAVAVGGMVLNLIFFRESAISLRTMIPDASRMLTVSCLVALAAGYLLWLVLDHSSTGQARDLGGATSLDLLRSVQVGGILVACFLLVTSFFVWRHPVRSKLQRLLLEVGRKE